MVNYTYNLTSADNVTSLTDWMVNINDQTNGHPITAVIILLWFATFVYMGSRNLDALESMISANFLTLIVGSLAYFAGLVALWIPVTLFALFIVSLIAKMFQ